MKLRILRNLHLQDISFQLMLGVIASSLNSLRISVHNETEIPRETCILIENYTRVGYLPELAKILPQFQVTDCPRNVCHVQLVYVTSNRCHYRVISRRWMV